MCYRSAILFQTGMIQYSYIHRRLKMQIKEETLSYILIQKIRVGLHKRQVKYISNDPETRGAEVGFVFVSQCRKRRKQRRRRLFGKFC